MSDPFIAEIKIFAGNFNPRGYAFCDGTLLPISQNTALFSLIGTIYGGDGRTTTGLPNLKDRIPIHAGNGPGLTPRKLGSSGGVPTVTLTEQQMANHTHNLVGSGDETDEEGETNVQNHFTGTTDASTRLYLDNGTSTNMSPDALATVGGGGAHTNLQPYLTLNYIIALTGTYPSRS